MKNKLLNKIDYKMIKYIAVLTAIIMIVAHGFCYFNILYSHDSMMIIHSGYGNFDDSLAIGRFLIPVWTFIRGEYYPPLVIGTLSIIFMILINYLICKMYSIEDKKNIFVLVLLLCTCSTITTLNATYIDYSDMYIFTILLNVLSVFLIRMKNNLSYLAIVALSLSLGIYQSYLGVALGLYIGLLLVDLIHNVDWKDVFKEGIRFIIFVIVSLLIYSLINKLVLDFSNINLNDNYNSISNAMKFSSFFEMIKCIAKTYIQFFIQFLYPHSFHRLLVLCLNVFVSLVAIYKGIKLINNHNVKRANIFLIILLCMAVPFALNIVYFISKGVYHELMIFALNIIYVFIVCLFSKDSKNCLTNISCVLLIIISSLNIIFSNQLYEKKKMELDSSISTMNRVIMMVEEVEGYEVGKTPVVIIGDVNRGPLTVYKEGLDYQTVGQKNPFVTTVNRLYYRFFNYYMGYPMNIVDKDATVSKTAEKFSNKKEVKQMPCYPKKNSVKMIDNYLVIKFSNN